METLLEAQSLLEQLTASPLIGITFLDENQREMSIYKDDPGLREAILEYQRERVRQLSLSEKTLTYPLLEE